MGATLDLNPNRADLMTFTAGLSVATFRDVTPANLWGCAPPYRNPLLQEEALNGRHVLFYNNGGYYDFSSIIENPEGASRRQALIDLFGVGPVNPGYTVVAVVKFPPQAQQRTLLHIGSFRENSEGKRVALGTLGDMGFPGFHWGDGYKRFGQTRIDDAVWHVVAWLFPAGGVYDEASLWVDGDQWVEAITETPTGSPLIDLLEDYVDHLLIGASLYDLDTWLPFEGYLARLLIYNSALVPNQVEQVSHDLAHLYDLGWGRTSMGALSSLSGLSGLGGGG